MQTVFLTNWRDYPLTISDEGFARITELVRQHLVCSQCEATYSEENPQVGQNLCLSCILLRQPELTYVGSQSLDAEGHMISTFLDQEGYVYSSREGYSAKAELDLPRTLSHWGFTLPESYTYAQQEIRLYRPAWQLHGNLRTASVVVAEYNHYSTPRFTAVFLCYKGGSFKELSKRNTESKQLLQKARELVELTKDEEGYHVGTYTTRSIFDSQVYEVVSMLESSLYDVQRRLCSNGNKPVAIPAPEAKETKAS